MQITQILDRLKSGECGALDDLMPLVYEDLRRIAHSRLRAEKRNLLMQTTVLVHETFLKLVAKPKDVGPAGISRWSSISRKAVRVFENRAHFFSVASVMMRQVLVDEARIR